MADIPNEGGEPRGESSAPEASPETTPAGRKKVARKKTARKKASKKIVAKKGAKKKVAKKKAAAPPAPPAPQWDDDQDEIGLIGQLVQWGPVLLIIALMLVLDAHPGSSGPHAGLEPPGGAGEGETEPLSGASGTGAVRIPDSFDPWSFSDSSPFGAQGQPDLHGPGFTPDTSWLEDPAAFYWGPAIVDEFPPPPQTGNDQ